MKKILVSLVVVMTFTSYSWAAETIRIHDQVNNAQAPAHRIQSSPDKSEIQGDSIKMMNMDVHGKAAMSHEMMQNKSSAAHQNMVEMHKKMMKSPTGTTNEVAKPFSKMNKHEKAAVVYEKSNNGQASVVQQQAERHRRQANPN